MHFGDMHGSMAILAMAAMCLLIWTRASRRTRCAATAGGREAQAPGEEASEAREVERLTAENAQLNGQIGRLAERIAVLERIATDPAERTAREIEALR